MLQWNELHPYNAVHVVRIPAAFDPKRLARAVNGTLAILGLTGLTLDRAHGTYEYRGGPVTCEIKTLDPGDGPHGVYDEIERQLNTPFIQGWSFNPFRFFAVPGTDGFSLGLVYFHALADAEAIVRLLRDLVKAYLTEGLNGGSPQSAPPELYPRYRDGMLARPGLLAGKIAALPVHIWNMRKTCRMVCRDVQDLSNGFTFFTLDAADLNALITTAKTWDVKLNDLFLALLIKNLSPFTPWRLRDPKRRNISVGCVVNLRKELGVEDRRTFGLFLGSWLVTHGLPAGTSLMELAKDIRRRTKEIKRRRLYLTPSLDMILACLMLPRFSRERQTEVYRKNYPLWGGITNLNLNPLWDRPPGETPPDYFRAVSTGPVTPLVLSVTTAGDNVNLGVTHRLAFYSKPDMVRLKAGFLEMVKQLKPGT